MAKPSKHSDEKTEDATQGSTTQYDRLERLASAASQAAQAKQWQARKNGMASQGEPSEVRSLNDDTEARAQAEAAMQQMLAKSGGNQRRR